MQTWKLKMYLEAWEIKEATEALETIEYRDVLQVKKAEKAMEGAVLENKIIPKMRPLEVEKVKITVPEAKDIEVKESTALRFGSVQKHKSMKEAWIPLQNCKPGKNLVSAEFNNPSYMVKGTLLPSSEESVLSTKDSEKNDVFGKANLHNLSEGRQASKSATIESSHNPEWNDKARFDVGETTPHDINISVSDGKAGKDNSLNDAVLKMLSIQKKNKVNYQRIHNSNCKEKDFLLPGAFVEQSKIVNSL